MAPRTVVVLPRPGTESAGSEGWPELLTRMCAVLDDYGPSIKYQPPFQEPLSVVKPNGEVLGPITGLHPGAGSLQFGITGRAGGRSD